MSNEFDLTDLNIDDLTVVTMLDSAALPEGGASYKSSSTCIVIV
jgi:Thiopeptide-type bacteriocin precursor